MNNTNLLILHGPPGSGKTSIAAAMAKLLGDEQVKHAVLDLDYLAKIYPRSLLGIMYTNLASIWPNYVALGDIKIIIPTYLQKGELQIVTDAAPANRTTVCEVTAPLQELERRILLRETEPTSRKLHLAYVTDYANNKPLSHEIDLRIVNHNKTQVESAKEILTALHWLQ